MNKHIVNRILTALAASTAILSPTLGANENPFQVKAMTTPVFMAEVVPPVEPKPEQSMKATEGRCSKMKGMMDSDKDGKVSKDEFIKHHEHMFGMMDKNGDGVLDDTEMAQMSEMMKHMGGGMGGMNQGGGMGGMDHGAGGGMKHEMPPAAKP